MLEKDANTDYQNYLISVLTVIAQKPKIVYEFLGCFYHGCKCQLFRDLETKNEDTLAERYERTMSSIEQIKRTGFQVKLQWECECDAS